MNTDGLRVSSSLASVIGDGERILTLKDVPFLKRRRQRNDDVDSEDEGEEDVLVDGEFEMRKEIDKRVLGVDDNDDVDDDEDKGVEDDFEKPAREKKLESIPFDEYRKKVRNTRVVVVEDRGEDSGSLKHQLSISIPNQEEFISVSSSSKGLHIDTSGRRRRKRILLDVNGKKEETSSHQQEHLDKSTGNEGFKEEETPKRRENAQIDINKYLVGTKKEPKMNLYTFSSQNSNNSNNVIHFDKTLDFCNKMELLTSKKRKETNTSGSGNDKDNNYDKTEEKRGKKKRSHLELNSVREKEYSTMRSIFEDRNELSISSILDMYKSSQRDKNDLERQMRKDSDNRILDNNDILKQEQSSRMVINIDNDKEREKIQNPVTKLVTPRLNSVIIEKRDEEGNLLTTKEDFKLMSHKFHGTYPTNKKKRK